MTVVVALKYVTKLSRINPGEVHITVYIKQALEISAEEDGYLKCCRKQ